MDTRKIFLFLSFKSNQNNYKVANFFITIDNSPEIMVMEFWSPVMCTRGVKKIGYRYFIIKKKHLIIYILQYYIRKMN